MPRYIDADKAEKDFEETFCKHCNSYDGAKCRACDMKDGADIFNDAPTEDVQPVIHAHWITTPMKTVAYCSNCKGWFVMYNQLFDTDKYCRFCGAKMDKEE